MEIIQFVDGIAVGRRSSYELINSGLTLEKKKREMNMNSATGKGFVSTAC